MGEIEEFNPLVFEKKLMQLKDTQESIQSLSSWCLKQRDHHKKIVASWLNVLKRVKVEQRLTLFYLANDVIQYSKRKNYDFVESWGLNLQKATPLVRDEKVRHKILRIFKIWEQRGVYDDEFLSDLTGLLSAGAIKKTDDDPLDFQPQQLVNKIRQCAVLEADTDLRLKYIHESHLELSDADALCANLKDRSNKDDVEKELNEGIQCVERYTQALQREIVAREALLALLSTANQYYSTQRGEVKVVAYAYKNFGARVRALKRKLDDLIESLPSAAPSPPQRDEDVPSPGPDEDLDLPAGDRDVDELPYNIDQTFNTSVASDGSLYNLGLSSFLTSDNPMALFNESDTGVNNANRIEVISSRPNEKQDFDINNFLKTLVPNDNDRNANSDNNSVVSATLSQKSQDTLPGLDLLTPDSTGNPLPPTSFYGTMDSILDEPEPYHPEMTTQWNNTSTWSLPPAPVPPPVLSPPPPASPPPAPAAPPGNPVLVPTYPTNQEAPVTTVIPVELDMPAVDVDHRGILPPPPPPPVLPLLGGIEDVDHRLLPPPPPPVALPPIRHSGQQDVDHRNLIPLTRAAPRPAAPHQPPRLDQDYRVPPMMAPSDIVESVDMDLSEDEDQQGYSNEHRRSSFNNNKVLVGGNNGKTIRNENNLVQLNREINIPQHNREINMPQHNREINMPQHNREINMPLHNREINMPPHNREINMPQHNREINVPPPMAMPTLPSVPSIPSLLTKPPPPLSNPFDNMPQGLKNLNMPFLPTEKEENSSDSAYEDDLRSRGMEPVVERHSPPPEFEFEGEWQQRPMLNQRFPRNWGPRTNFRPPFPPPQGPWPRLGPRHPNRWMSPPRQRFW